MLFLSQFFALLVNNIRFRTRVWAKTIICLQELKDLGYLENTVIIDPRTDEYMNGGIGIVYDEDSKSYNYTYDEDEVSCD